jgi:hypothetical protein
VYQVWLGLTYNLATSVGFAIFILYLVLFFAGLIQAKSVFSSVRNTPGSAKWQFIEKAAFSGEIADDDVSDASSGDAYHMNQWKQYKKTVQDSLFQRGQQALRLEEELVAEVAGKSKE